jgi:hypothetical protein
MRAAVLVAVAACSGPDHPGRAVALEKCADAFSQIAAMTELSDTTAIYARGCADLYREPRCHDAVAKLAEVKPADRVDVLWHACATAYCPKMHEPLPELCAPGSPVRDLASLVAGWRNLDRRILALELDIDPASPALDRVAGVAVQSVRVSAPPRPSLPVDPVQ